MEDTRASRGRSEPQLDVVLLESIAAVPLAELLEYVAGELIDEQSAEVTLETVFRQGRFVRGYLRLGPLSSHLLEIRRTRT